MIRLFGHYISKTYLLLGLLEFLLFFFALDVGFYTRFGFDYASDEVVNSSLTGLFYAVFLVSSMTAVGLYQPGLTLNASLLVRLGLAFLFSSMAMSLLFYGFPELFLGRGVMAWAMAYSLFGVLLLRFVFFRLVGEEAVKRRVLVLGTGTNAASILEHSRTPNTTYSVVGFVPLDQRENQVPEDAWLRPAASLHELAVSEDALEIVVALDDRRQTLPVDDILDCKMAGIRILDLLSFFEKEALRIEINHLHPSWIFFSEGFNLHGFHQDIKRLSDLLVAGIMLLVASPLMVAVAVAILVESRGRGPIFYRQTRTGRGGQPFKLNKFRSMRTDAEADGVARWAQENDDRVTRVGAFIRKTRLDELPQLFNVLRGEMSLVGPRPERPEFIEQLAEQIPYYNERHRVKPGITGWAQLCYPYGSTTEDAKQKLQYDLYYVKNASAFLDLIILLETVEVVLWRKGAR